MWEFYVEKKGINSVLSAQWFAARKDNYIILVFTRMFSVTY